MTDVQTEAAIDQLIEYRLAPLRKRIEALERDAQPQSSKEAREKEITRLATIEECAKVAELYPSSGEQTEHPVEYWIRRLSHSRPLHHPKGE